MSARTLAAAGALLCLTFSATEAGASTAKRETFGTLSDGSTVEAVVFLVVYLGSCCIVDHRSSTHDGIDGAIKEIRDATVDPA